MILVTLNIKLYLYPNIRIKVCGKSNSSCLLCTTSMVHVLQEMRQKTNATINELSIPVFANRTGITSREEPTIVLLTLSMV